PDRPVTIVGWWVMRPMSPSTFSGPKITRTSDSLKMADTFDLNDSEVVDVYDDLPVWSAMMLLRHVPFPRGRTCWMSAAAPAFPTLEVAQRLGPAASVTGIDPWPRLPGLDARR